MIVIQIVFYKKRCHFFARRIDATVVIQTKKLKVKKYIKVTCKVIVVVVDWDLIVYLCFFSLQSMITIVKGASTTNVKKVWSE